MAAAVAPHYTLGRELGRGGMGTVWLARDLRHDRPVALKVLASELALALGGERFGSCASRAADPDALPATEHRHDFVGT